MEAVALVDDGNFLCGGAGGFLNVVNEFAGGAGVVLLGAGGDLPHFAFGTKVEEVGVLLGEEVFCGFGGVEEAVGDGGGDVVKKLGVVAR